MEGKTRSFLPVCFLSASDRVRVPVPLSSALVPTPLPVVGIPGCSFSDASNTVLSFRVTGTSHTSILLMHVLCIYCFFHSAIDLVFGKEWILRGEKWSREVRNRKIQLSLFLCSLFYNHTKLVLRMACTETT